MRNEWKMRKGKKYLQNAAPRSQAVNSMQANSAQRGEPLAGTSRLTGDCRPGLSE